MKQKRTLASIADQTTEMWKNGNPAKEIVDVIAKEVGGIVCDTPMREKAAGMYGIEAFHPFDLANMDVNVVRNLCSGGCTHIDHVVKCWPLEGRA